MANHINPKPQLEKRMDAGAGGGGGNYYAGQGLSLKESTFSLNIANQADLGGVRLAGAEIVSADDPSAEYGIFKKTTDGFPALRTALSYQKGGFFLGDGLVPVLEEGENSDGETVYSASDFVQLRLGGGLEFVDNDEVSTDTKELRENHYGGRRVSVKIDGTTLKLNDKGELTAEGYVEGAAIAFRVEDEKTSINVNYDDETLKADGGTLYVNIDNETIKLNDDGKLTSIGVTIENGIIIQEADAKYLLHEYTEVEYVAGNRIGYAGPQNQIIVQGLIVYKLGGTAPNGVTITGGNQKVTDASLLPDMPLYTDFSFASPTHRNNGNYEVSRVFLRLASSATTYNNHEQIYVKDDGTEVTITSFDNYDGYIYGWFLLWTNIYPPGYVDANGVTYPYGCVTCNMLRKYKSSATQYYLDNGNSSINALNIGFASEAEYNAAVGLTYEPLTLTEVQETTTEV